MFKINKSGDAWFPPDRKGWTHVTKQQPVPLRWSWVDAWSSFKLKYSNTVSMHLYNLFFWNAHYEAWSHRSSVCPAKCLPSHPQLSAGWTCTPPHDNIQWTRTITSVLTASSTTVAPQQLCRAPPVVCGQKEVSHQQSNKLYNKKKKSVVLCCVVLCCVVLMSLVHAPSAPLPMQQREERDVSYHHKL